MATIQCSITIIAWLEVKLANCNNCWSWFSTSLLVNVSHYCRKKSYKELKIFKNCMIIGRKQKKNLFSKVTSEKILLSLPLLFNAPWRGAPFSLPCCQASTVRAFGLFYKTKIQYFWISWSYLVYLLLYSCAFPFLCLSLTSPGRTYLFLCPLVEIQKYAKYF